MKRVIEVEGNNIENAYCNGSCPHCGAEERRKSQIKHSSIKHDSKHPIQKDIDINISVRGPWLDRHLTKCKSRIQDIEASNKLKTQKARWVVHGDCGRVFILEIHDGLVLVESDHRRYVVCAADLTYGRVGAIVELIKEKNLSDDEIKEIIGHLLAEGRILDIGTIMPMIGAGRRIEFRHAGKIVLGRIKRKHGNSRYIVEFSAGSCNTSMNIGREEIVRIVE